MARILGHNFYCVSKHWNYQREPNGLTKQLAYQRRAEQQAGNLGTLMERMPGRHHDDRQRCEIPSRFALMTSKKG